MVLPCVHLETGQSDGSMMARPRAAARRANLRSARSCVSSHRAPQARAKSTKIWSSLSEHNSRSGRPGVGGARSCACKSKVANAASGSGDHLARLGCTTMRANSSRMAEQASQITRPPVIALAGARIAALSNTNQSRTALVSSTNPGGVWLGFSTLKCARACCGSCLLLYTGKLFGELCSIPSLAVRQ